MNNHLRLAVAGGRKTQSLVDHCASAAADRRILVLTYTLANQEELRARLSRHRPLAAKVEVLGWFAFLLNAWIRPYLPRRFADRRLYGLNFAGDPGRFATDEARFLDSEGKAYKLHLAQLAIETNKASDRAVLDRIRRMYDEILIDEVQDLNGYDLEILEALLELPTRTTMVGDVRQALLHTNPRDPKNRQFKGIGIKGWFERQERRGLLTIEHESLTWRSNQLIADFADSIFAQAWGFGRTRSNNTSLTGHDGVFAVAPANVGEYVKRYQPMCLRHSANSAKQFELPFITFGMAKGLSADRVLIAPTHPILNFLCGGHYLSNQAACGLYVGVTRARASVAFVVPAERCAPGMRVWIP